MTDAQAPGLTDKVLQWAASFTGVNLGKPGGGAKPAAGGQPPKQRSGDAKPPPQPPKTVTDFAVQDAAPQDLKDFEQALSYLQLSPTAAGLVQRLPKEAKISIIHNGDDRYDPDTKTIYWDPRSALGTTSGQGLQSAALGLAHEIDHAVNGIPNPHPTGDGYENTEEQRVIKGTEGQIAVELNEPARYDHGGSAGPLNSPTDHNYYKDGNPPPISSDIPGKKTR